jgi:hypothetical protein
MKFIAASALPSFPIRNSAAAVASLFVSEPGEGKQDRNGRSLEIKENFGLGQDLTLCYSIERENDLSYSLVI